MVSRKRLKSLSLNVLISHKETVRRGENWNGSTPLILAAQNGHIEIIKLLLATGQVNLKTENFMYNYAIILYTLTSTI